MPCVSTIIRGYLTRPRGRAVHRHLYKATLRCGGPVKEVTVQEHKRRDELKDDYNFLDHSDGGHHLRMSVDGTLAGCTGCLTSPFTGMPMYNVHFQPAWLPREYLHACGNGSRAELLES